MSIQPQTDDDFTSGCVLKIKTTQSPPDEFTATVITHDKSTNLLILQEKDSSSTNDDRKNLRFLKTTFIKEFTLLRRDPDPFRHILLDDHSPFSLDLNALQAKEVSAIRQAEADAERIGVGVTVDAQNIFDALSKTLPVRWDKTVIVVMNEVRVSSPYLPESVIGGTPAANDRVRKVLEFERKRLNVRG